MRSFKKLVNNADIICVRKRQKANIKVGLFLMLEVTYISLHQTRNINQRLNPFSNRFAKEQLVISWLIILLYVFLF
jgi:hypothetical protein